MDIRVRSARPADRATIVDFNCRLAEESEGKQLRRADVEAGVSALLGDPRKGRYFIATVPPQDAATESQRSAAVQSSPAETANERIVGQLMHTFEWSDWRNGDIWWLQSVYVHPDFRRMGVFRALFDHLRQAAAADPGVVGLRLYVEEQNAQAHATYARLGLKPGGYFVMEQMLRRSDLSPPEASP